MKEKDVQTIFGKKNQVQGVFELKLVKGLSFAFDRVADHQVKALTEVSSGSWYYKIPDSPVSWGGRRFSATKPFDCLMLKNAPAYVVLIWYVPRKRKTAYYIKIEDFVKYRDGSSRKSMREEECAFIAIGATEL